MEPIAISQLSAVQIATAVALFLPGFVSLKVDRLIQPGEQVRGSDMIAEATAYSLVNAGVLFWPILSIFRELASPTPSYLTIWLLAALACAVGPVVWPFVFRVVQRFGAKRKWLLRPERYAWDAYFAERRPTFVIVHMKDGSRIGGYFGKRSHASTEPVTGHLYLEELWELDDDGRFVAAVPDSLGGLFRPDDYVWIELFEDD